MVETDYNEPRRPEKKSGWKLFDWQDHPGQGKGPGSDSAEDSEKARAKLATEASGGGARAKSTGGGGDDSPIVSVAQFIGESWNAGVDAASGIDAQKKFVDNVSPAVAQEFKRGKELTDAGYTTPARVSTLKQDDRKALEVYERINGDMVASIPFYEQNALRRNIEQGILSKAVEAENRPERTDSPPRQPAAEPVTASALNLTADRIGAFKDTAGAIEKVEPRSGGAQAEARPAWLAKGQENNALFADKPQAAQTEARPAWLVKGQENNVLFADKPNSTASGQSKAIDTKVAPRVPDMKSPALASGADAPRQANLDMASKLAALDVQSEKAGQSTRFSQEPARKAESSAGRRQPGQADAVQPSDRKSQGGRGTEQKVEPVQMQEAKTAFQKPPNRAVVEVEPRNSKVDESFVNDRRMKALPLPDSQTNAKQPIERPGGQLHSEAQSSQSRSPGGPVREAERAPGGKVDSEGTERGCLPALRATDRRSDLPQPEARQDRGPETPARSLEPAGDVQPRAGGQPRTLLGEAPPAIVSRSQAQKSAFVTSADGGKPETSQKSFVGGLRIHTYPRVIETLNSAQVESAKEPGVPRRVVYGSAAPAALTAGGNVRVGKCERVERIPGMLPPEGKSIDTARGTKFDTASARSPVASNGAGKSNLAPVDGCSPASQAYSTRVDAPTIRGVAHPTATGDGPKPRAIRDIRITAVPQNIPTDKRYITGTEIALAAVIAAAGAARVRAEAQAGRPGGLPGSEQNQAPPTTSRIGPRRPAQTSIEQTEVPGRAQTSAWPATGNAPYLSPERSVLPVTDRIPAIAGEQAQIDAPDSTEELVAVLPSLELVDHEQGGHGRTMRISRSENREHGPAHTPAGRAGSDYDGCAPHPVLRRPTTLMSRGDTFVSIAEAFFNDSNLAWLIADLNRDRTSESCIDGRRVVEIRSRQQIELPVWQDIADFYRRRPLDAIPDNVVTIVRESRLDAELLLTGLGGVMGFAGVRPQHSQQSMLWRSAGQDSLQSPFKRWRK